ncbi:nicotinamide n-methyltransferase, partial [Blyttiomyces sp. JEL0837]
TPAVFKLHLVGRHSLWAHRLWNAGIVLARHLDKDKELCKGKRVLELGAAASLPSMIAALNGAEKVVITDWPEPTLMNNIINNAKVNTPEQWEIGIISALGYQWGQDLDPLLDLLPDKTRKYDAIYLADLIFNHTEHRNLLKTCVGTLEPETGIIYVYFSHHVVKWADRDDKFFELAKDEFGLEVEKIGEVRASAMFPDDVGDLTVRETVHCYKLWMPKKSIA